MSAKLFFDTNIFIYAVTNDPVRTSVAQAWLAKGGNISVQVLNEFANTARRKLHRSWEQIEDALTAVRIICSECVSITEQTHDLAVDLANRYGFGLYDALIVASALESTCTILVTEDLQHCHILDGRLKIHNPFKL